MIYIKHPFTRNVNFLVIVGRELDSQLTTGDRSEFILLILAVIEELKILVLG